nr:hypothetical protein [Bacteroidota bacterium]
MKKTLLLLVLMLVSITAAFTQNSVWSLPGQYGKFNPNLVLFPLPTPTLNLPDYLYYQGQRANFSHNAMQDAQGNLLFFIVDDKIYDRNGFLIDEMKISGIKVRGSQEICIVPVPGSCTRYYIFSNYRIGNYT